MRDTQKEIRQIKKEQYVVLAGSILLGSITPLYHIYLNRKLGAEGYGHFYVLMSLLSILLMPLNPLQTLVSGTVAQLKKNHFVGLRELIHSIFLRLFLIGIGITVLFYGFRESLASLFYLPNTSSVVWIGCLVPIALVLPLLIGALHGLQRFVSASILAVLDVILRFGATIFFLEKGFQENSALFACFVGTLVVAIFSYGLLRQQFSSERTRASSLGEYWENGVPISGILFVFSLITQLDILYVKHYFPSEAGYYATASFLGKSLLLIPQPFIVVMVPKVAQLVHEKEASFYLGGYFVLTTTFVCLMTSLTFILLPQDLIASLFGKDFLPMLPFLKMIGFAVTPLASLSVLIYYNVARRFLAFFSGILSWFFILVFALFFWRLTPLQVLYFYTLSGFITLTGLFIQTFLSLTPQEPLQGIYNHFLPYMVLRSLKNRLFR